MPPVRSDLTWYVVMNASRARILRGLPREGEPLPSEITMQGRRRKLRETLNGRPTRSFSSASGGRRSAVEPGTDPLREDARIFLQDVFEFLEQQHGAGAFRSMVLIGAPDIVGLWRHEISGPLKESVKAEFDKNLVRLSSGDLVEAIRSLVVKKRG